MKAKINVQSSGIKGSLMHLEARKDSHPNEALFITWCKISDNRYSYAWQLMHAGAIQAADCSARTVTHEELGRNIEDLIENTFIDAPFQHIDQEDFLMVD